MTPEELAVAIRAGLKPVAQQHRMRILTVSFAAALLLTMAVISVARRHQRLLRLTPANNLLAAIPFASIMGASLLVPHKSAAFDPLAGIFQAWLLHLSPLLPASDSLMTAVLIAALCPLYWLLEAVFRRTETWHPIPEETA